MNELILMANWCLLCWLMDQLKHVQHFIEIVYAIYLARFRTITTTKVESWSDDVFIPWVIQQAFRANYTEESVNKEIIIIFIDSNTPPHFFENFSGGSKSTGEGGREENKTTQSSFFSFNDSVVLIIHNKLIPCN